MKSKEVDLSALIIERDLLSVGVPPSSPERLLTALDLLSSKTHVSRARLLEVYKRGYLEACEEANQGCRAQRGLARTLLFIRMTQGKVVPYLYRKLDQDLLAPTRRVFDDNYREALLFNTMQLIEASLLGRRFGIEFDEEELLLFLKKYDT